MRWPLVAVCVALSCRGATEPTTVAASPCAWVEPAAAAPAPSCIRAAFRYALIAPLYSPIENITAVELATLLRGTPKRRIGMSGATRTALAAPAGPDFTEPTATQWAIVPAHELRPGWQVITVDGVHPLTRTATGPLVAQVCGAPNIDPDALTSVAMTGVTAMTRFTAQLMDKKGVTYPARDVAAWLGEADFVHASNEVSFTETCAPKLDRTERAFCSRDHYIELLAALHVNIVELTGSHLIDFGLRHLRRTIEMYEARGWQFFGGGRDQIEATRPLIIEHHGNKLAFLGCNVPRSENTTIVNGPNVAFCDLARLDWQVRDLRARGFTPIVSIQHNEVTGHTPPHTLVHDFRRLARAGAAAVLGSQAHVAHPFEVHAGAFVHFGLGNFIFDQPWISTRDGIADRLYFHRGVLLSVRRLYTRIEEQGRPRPLDDAERARFLGILTDEVAALPKPRKLHAVADEAAIPDSFLVGKVPVFLWITRATDAATVSLRSRPRGLRKKQLAAATAEFVATKYGIDRQRVTIR